MDTGSTQIESKDYGKLPVLLKVALILFYGGITSFLSFINLHMIQVGLSIEEIAVISAALPFASCLGSIIASSKSRHLERRKLMLIACIFGTGAFHTLLLTTDEDKMSFASPSNKSSPSSVYVTCDKSDLTYLQWQSCTNATCLDELTQMGNVVKVIPSDCYHSCGSNESAGVNLCESAGSCSPRNQDFLLRIKVDDVNEPAKNVDLCTIGVSQFYNYDFTRVTLGCQCLMQCSAWMINSQFSCLTNVTSEPDHKKYQHIFWLYLIIRIMATCCLSISINILDAALWSLAKRRDIGKHRLYGIVGSAISASISGPLLDWIAEMKGFHDYGIVFYFGDLLMAAACCLLLFVDLKLEKNEKKFWRNAFKLTRFLDVDIFLSIVLILGLLGGFFETYLFIFLAELNASPTILGLSITLGSVICLPFLYISDFVVTKVGQITILLTAFFVFFLRFIGYSFIQNPWLSLLLETLDAITVHLIAVSILMFCYSAAPVGLTSTLQRLSRDVCYSIGKGIGSLIGGTLIASYGMRLVFRVFGIIAGCAGFFYLSIYLLYIRKYHTERLRAVGRWVSISFHVRKKVEGSVHDSENNAIIRFSNDSVTRRVGS